MLNTVLGIITVYLRAEGLGYTVYLKVEGLGFSVRYTPYFMCVDVAMNTIFEGVRCLLVHACAWARVRNPEGRRTCK